MDVKISALPAAAAASLDQLLAIVNDPSGTPVTQKLTLTQLTTLVNATGPFTGNLTGNVTGNLTGTVTGGSSLNVLKAGDTMTGLLTIAQGTANTTALAVSGYSLTGANAQSMLSLAGTWNTSGNPVALRLAITNTASGATSKFLEFLAGAGGATSVFDVAKDGAATSAVAFRGPLGSISSTTLSMGATTNTGFFSFSLNSDISTSISGVRVHFFSPSAFGILNNSAALELGAGLDTKLVRDEAQTLASRNGTTAQAYRVYRTFTNSTNYERLALQTAAGQMILAAETAGTGTDDLDLVLTPAGVGRVTLPGGAQLLKTTAAMTSGAGASAGTLGNAPSIGNPAVWCPIMFNGVQHWFPCWT